MNNVYGLDVMSTSQQLSFSGERFLQILAQAQARLELYQTLGVSEILCKTSRPGPGPTVSLEAIHDTLKGCQRCKLHRSRTHIVFGSGNSRANLVMIGEGPGEQEDLHGLPFVGPAGELLTRILEAIDLGRDDVYITNIVKCRPPGNRDPEPDEVATCTPFLHQQLEVIQPKIICALGRCAAQTLLQTTTPISKLRGKFYDYRGMQLMPTYHPAYLLRNPRSKRDVWHDMQLIQQVYQTI